MVRFLWRFILVVSILVASSGIAVPVDAVLTGGTVIEPASSNSPALGYGINLLSTHWHYEIGYLPAATLDRDLSQFRSQGLRFITLALVGKYMEPEMGVYNEEALLDLRRVCEAADEHGLGVVMDFHTLMFADSWTMPEWLSPRRFQTVFKDPMARQAWLNFLDHTVSSLSDVPNIDSWHMMNEPALHDWACDVTVDEFIVLWGQMKAVVRLHSSLPVSIRFASEVFDSHFNRDPRIYDICDYIALNWYEDLYPVASLTGLVSEIVAHRPVMISEFGLDTADDEAQRQAYQTYIALFMDLGVSDCAPFYWRADYSAGEPATSFKLAEYVPGETPTGKPRPAFYELKTVSTVSIQSSANTIVVGGHVTLSGLITPTRPGAEVTITCTGPAGAENHVSITDYTSLYSYLWTPSTTGTFKIHAGWVGDTATLARALSGLLININKRPNSLLQGST
jgi:hypothetical protein